MAKAETSPFSAEHIAQFHRIQQVRKQILHKMGNLLEVWRNCENKACQRAKSCRRDDATRRAMSSSDRSEAYSRSTISAASWNSEVRRRMVEARCVGT